MWSLKLTRAAFAQTSDEPNVLIDLGPHQRVLPAVDRDPDDAASALHASVVLVAVQYMDPSAYAGESDDWALSRIQASGNNTRRVLVGGDGQGYRMCCEQPEEVARAHDSDNPSPSDVFREVVDGDYCFGGGWSGKTTTTVPVDS